MNRNVPQLDASPFMLGRLKQIKLNNNLLDRRRDLKAENYVIPK